MQKDTDNIGKVMNATTKWFLGVASALTVMAIVYIFSTAISNEKSLAVITTGMDNVVTAVENNTATIRDMNKGNVAGHNTIALMVYGVKEEVGKSTVRIDALVEDLEKAIGHMDEHEKMIPKFEAWKSKVNIHMDDCIGSLKECEQKIEALEHERFINGN